MALIVAPYNPAMRLGMGFNSFTQQLCVNDAVKPANETNTGAEAKLVAQRPQYLKGLMDAKDSTGAAVSQSVTWTAKFVDRMSEVTDSMNVSGSLQIKCDAIGGGGGAGASFLDANKFKESDINYFIQVKVTNQQLVAPDLTEFCPIQGVHEADFTRVYGDSFISGYIEGGEFNALVSIKLADRSQAKKISGDLKVSFDVKAATVEGEAHAEIQKGLQNIDGETTITVSWTGGGDIKDETVDDWTLETLKKVALEFPEHVMSCPMRTNAILTKYTNLKSFYTNQKGSPLDYESAGVYSSALLDAYMDYKVMWRNIQQAAWELEQGQSSLEMRRARPQFADLARQAQEHYQSQLAIYEKKKQAYEQAQQDAASADSGEETVLATRAPTAPPPECPLPPNNLEPYSDDIFGLDKARRDCRFEMIKIVKEVDAVAEDPKVAVDPSRTWQYLSPAVFRMLLPTVKNLNLEAEEKKAKDEAAALAAADAKDKEAKANELSDLKSKLAAAEAKQRDTESKLNEAKQKQSTAEATLREIQPYGDYCPVPLDTPVRLRTFASNKSVDYNHGLNDRPVQLWDSGAGNGCQKWVIRRANRLGFYIQHMDTGRYLSLDTGAFDRNSAMVWMGVRDYGCVFVFEPAANNTVLIRLADKTPYSMNPFTGSSANGTKFVLWPNQKGDLDRWYVEAFR